MARGQHIRFRVDPGDIPPDKAARRLHLTLEEFSSRLPDLTRRGFPAPDPTTGMFCLEAIDRWSVLDAAEPEQAAPSTFVWASADFAWSHVYVIGSDDGPVKIGFSTSPEVRLHGLQTSSPCKLRVLARTPGGQLQEAAIHQALYRDRLEGEWFGRSATVRKLIEMMNDGIAVSTIVARCREAGSADRRGC